MARVVFLVLVLANLVAFVWAAGYLGAADSGREPERLRQQLEPDRMKVSLDGTPVATKVASTAPVKSCRRTGPLGSAEADALEKAITEQGGAATRTSVDDVTYWVFIPAADDKPADKEIATLKKAGFKEFNVVTEEGPNRNAISFGYFQKESSAKDKIARLLKNGIKSARIAIQATPTGTVTLNVRGPTGVLDKALAGLAAETIECPKE
jgi:hypothetical protein